MPWICSLPDVKRILLKGLLFLALFCLCQTGFGQQIYIIGADNSHLLGKGWMAPESVAYLKSMKLNYKKPDGFKETYLASECFEPNSKLARMLTCVGNKLYTEEGDFIVFMPVYPILSPKDVANWKEIIPNFKYEIDQLHINQVRQMIKVGLGDKAAGEWRKHVTYYSTKDAKSKFNADTAITFSLKLDSTEYYKNKYKYLDVLLIQKNGRSFVGFYCFYDEKGKKNLPKYRKAIEDILRYED